MADLVLGLASSHSPQLSTPSEGWRDRGERDKGNQELIGTDGIVSNYEDLLARADVWPHRQRDNAGKNGTATPAEPEGGCPPGGLFEPGQPGRAGNGWG